MENTLLVALSHQDALRRRMDVIANNLANMNTTGFKAQRLLFEQHLVPTEGADRGSREALAFVHDLATLRDFRDGGLEATGNPLDLAVNGEGWFVVETPDGERYTRNGSFRIDEGGRLVTSHGHPVLGAGNQPLILDAADPAVSVGRDGTISSGTRDIGRLRIVRFENPHALRAVVGNLMAADAPATDVAAPEVAQGMLERSNVEPIVEITRLIGVQRAYAAASKLIDREDERIRTMVEEYAR